MFVTGPNVVKTVTQEDVTSEELGGAETQASKSGVAHLACANEAECLLEIRELFDFIPQNCEDDPPVRPSQDPADRIAGGLNDIVPTNPNLPYDMLDVIRHVVDEGRLFVIHPDYSEIIIVRFSHIVLRSFSFMANQPYVLNGWIIHDVPLHAVR